MEQQEISLEIPINENTQPKPTTHRDKLKENLTQRLKILTDYLSSKKQSISLIRRDLFRLIIFNILGFFWAKGQVLNLFHPLGLAYLSLFFGEGIFFYTVLCSVAFSSLFMPPLKMCSIFISALAIELTLGNEIHSSDKGKKALLAGFAMALAGIFYAVAGGGLTFYFLVALVESVLVTLLSYLAQKGMSIFSIRDKNFVLTKEEILGFLFLFSGAFVGLSNIDYPILQEFVLSLLCIYFILISAYSEGMSSGSCAGLILGFLLYLCGGITSDTFVLLGITGLLSGAVKELGKIIMSALAISLPMLLLMYNNSTELSDLWLDGWVLGSLLFLLTPKKILIIFQGQSFIHESNKNIYIKKKKLLEQKLLDFSKAFYALGKTFKPTTQLIDKKDIVTMVDKITENACTNCGVAHYCWEEDLYRSYKNTVTALSICEENGVLYIYDMPENFQESCVRSEAFIEEINRTYQIYRRDKVWIGRLEECRTLVGKQMDAVGDLLKELSGAIETPCNFLDNLSQNIHTALSKSGAVVKEVQVTEEQSNHKKRVEIIIKGCNCNKNCHKKYTTIVKDCIGKPMILKDKNTCHCNSKGECKLIYKEIPMFQLTVASVSSSSTNDTSGDSTGFIQTDDGIALMAISDGMGKGLSASQESLTAIELLEQFSEAGFSRELAVKMINSALLLRRQEESYATLDICAVDLFSGTAQFIKLGAVSSYIFRSQRLLSITAHTLPAGILEEVEIIEKEFDLKDNDIIIMLTDGITEILGDEHTTAQWIKDKLTENPMANPEDIAIWLMNCVKNMGKATDDMTIAVGKFWKKI